MDSNGSHRSWEMFNGDTRRGADGLIAYLRALQIYRPRHPSCNSIVAHFHYAEQPPTRAGLDETPVLLILDEIIIRFYDFKWDRISATHLSRGCSWTQIL